MKTFIIVGEDVVYNKALEVAIERAASGFDAYFIALAALTDSILVADDKPMAGHAKALGVEVVLVREASLQEIREKLAGHGDGGLAASTMVVARKTLGPRWGCVLLSL